MSAVTPGDGVVVRPGERRDLDAISAVHGHYARETPVTFDLRPYTPDEREEWFGHYATEGRHRLFVAELDGEVLGYTSSSRYRPKAAYETTVETSIMLRPGATGRGTGSALYRALFDALAGEDVHLACAGITMPNEASEALHLAFGYRRVGTFTGQGRKLGAYWDVAWFEKPLGPDWPA